MESAYVLQCLWLGSAKDASARILADVVEYHPAFLPYESRDLAFQALTTLFHEFCQRHHLDASLIEEISLVKLSVDSINFDYPLGFAKGYVHESSLLSFPCGVLEWYADRRIEVPNHPYNSHIPLYGKLPYRAASVQNCSFLVSQKHKQYPWQNCKP